MTISLFRATMAEFIKWYKLWNESVLDRSMCCCCCCCCCPSVAAAAYLFWTHSNPIFHVARSFWLPLDVGYITNQQGKKITIENSVFYPPLLKLCYFSQNLLCSSYECSWLPNLVFVNHYTIRYGAWNELPYLTVITSSKLITVVMN